MVRRIGTWVALAMLAGCGSTSGSVTEDGPQPLSEAEISPPCGDARIAQDCEFAMSAEGDMFTSCECTATVEGSSGTMHITGSNLSRAEVDATYKIHKDGDRWRIDE